MSTLDGIIFVTIAIGIAFVVGAISYYFGVDYGKRNPL